MGNKRHHQFHGIQRVLTLSWFLCCNFSVYACPITSCDLTRRRSQFVAPTQDNFHKKLPFFNYSLVILKVTLSDTPSHPFHDDQQRKNKTTERSFQCFCSNLTPDRTDPESHNPDLVPCFLQRTSVTLFRNSNIFTDISSPLEISRASVRASKFQRTESKAFYKDVVNERGPQSQKNVQLLHREKTDMISCQRPGAEHRGSVGLLLMSALQRGTPDESSRGLRILQNALVILAFLKLLLGDQKTMKTAKNSFILFSSRLMSRRRNVHRTARTLNDSNKSILFESDAMYPKHEGKFDQKFGGASSRGTGGIPFSVKNCHHKKDYDKGCCCMLSNEWLNSEGRDVMQVVNQTGEGLTAEQLPFTSYCPADFKISRQYLVYPATSFLPVLGSAGEKGDVFDHLGYRLASLAAIPPSCSISRVKMAEAGFHYDPRANASAVLCHRCKAAYSLAATSMSGASFSGDGEASAAGSLSPLDFHKSVSPDCPFLKQLLESSVGPTTVPGPSGSNVTTGVIKAQQVMSEMTSSRAPKASLTLPTGAAVPVFTSGPASGRDLAEDCEASGPFLGAANSNLSQSGYKSSGYTLALSSSSADQQRMRYVTSDGAQGRGSVEDKPHLDLSAAVYPQFSTAPTRLATFQKWPLNDTFPPQNLVSLGFYYAGYADCIRCFFCGVGLKAWEPTDDVLQEHARWRPNCNFLLATKGRQCIQDILAKLEGGTTSQQTQNPSQTSQTQNPRQTSESQVPQSRNIGRPHGAAADGSNAGLSRSSLHSASANPGGRSSLPDPQNQLQKDAPEVARDQVKTKLLVMGFTEEQIGRARQRLLSDGKPLDLEHFVNYLLEEI